jgi:small nuclear ribonucleoprotein
MAVPLKILENSLNKKISLLLKDNRVLIGKLSGFDDYMNMVLDDTEEQTDEKIRKIGTVILRGNNVVRITIK